MTLSAPRRGRTFLHRHGHGCGRALCGHAARTDAAALLERTRRSGATAAKQAPADAGVAKTPAGSPAAATAGTKSAASYSLGVIMGTQLHNGGVRATGRQHRARDCRDCAMRSAAR